MTFLEKLDRLMDEKSVNKADLSRISGVPYTTIDGFYKKGYENAKISTIRKIAHALETSLDYLVEDSGEPVNGSAQTVDPAAALEESLTADMEELLRTLTPQQAALLCKIAARWLEHVKTTAAGPLCGGGRLSLFRRIKRGHGAFCCVWRVKRYTFHY